MTTACEGAAGERRGTTGCRRRSSSPRRSPQTPIPQPCPPGCFPKPPQTGYEGRDPSDGPEARAAVVVHPTFNQKGSFLCHRGCPVLRKRSRGHEAAAGGHHPWRRPDSQGGRGGLCGLTRPGGHPLRMRGLTRPPAAPLSPTGRGLPRTPGPRPALPGP